MYVCKYVHMHSAVQQTESQFSTHTSFASFTVMCIAMKDANGLYMDQLCCTCTQHRWAATLHRKL